MAVGERSQPFADEFLGEVREVPSDLSHARRNLHALVLFLSGIKDLLEVFVGVWWNLIILTDMYRINVIVFPDIVDK